MLTSAVVPVAGIGTRMLPATKSQPKEMLPVGKKPIVQYVVEELVSAGIEQILFVTGRGKHSIENHFDFDHQLMLLLRETGTGVLVVNGDRDPFGVPEVADATRLVVLAGESHALSRRPEAVADAVSSWLRDVLGLPR